MRQMISGLIVAAAVMTAGAAPASACGWGTGCSPCGWTSPCAQTGYVPTTTFVPTTTYVATAPYGLGGCGTCGWGWGWGFERLAEPTTQYYYVNQGPTFSGPGAFAPYPTYQENAIPYRWHRHYYHRPLRYGYRTGYPVRRYY